MSYEYYNDGRQRAVTDFRGSRSQQLWHNCCGRNQGRIDEADHGSLSNTDFYGNVTHTAFVENLQSDVSVNDNGLDVVGDPDLLDVDDARLRIDVDLHDGG